MQFEIRPYAVPEIIDFNYEEMKRELTERTEMYKTLVYTEDQIKEAKADRALLNKTKDALNAERIRNQRIYMKPFEDFKAKVDDLISTINEASAVIDRQVREYEERQKKEKESAIRELFPQIGMQPFVTFEKVWNPKWLNKSYTMKQIEQDMRDFLYRVSNEILTLNSIPEKETALEYYKKTLDLNEAINAAQEHARIEKMKAQAAEEAEKRRKEREAAAAQRREEVPTPEPVANKAPERRWISFQAYLSREEAYRLKEFFETNRIEFKPIA